MNYFKLHALVRFTVNVHNLICLNQMYVVMRLVVYYIYFSSYFIYHKIAIEHYFEMSICIKKTFNSIQIL